MFEVVESVAHMQSESKAKVLEERLSKLQERENRDATRRSRKKVNETTS